MPWCPACGYDLAAHTPGSTCPECGARVEEPADLPPGRSWPGGAALAAALGIPGLMSLIPGEPALGVLAGALLVSGVTFPCAMRQRRRRHAAALLLSGAALGVPVLTFFLFLVVFVIGGSSNVAQLAGDSGFDLWSLWFELWPLLLFGNPLSALVALIALAVPPYRPRYIASWALPINAIVAALAAASIAITYFPDA